MKTNKKKSSTMKKLLPAFAMLTVSAISLSSATYAWFTMNKSVEVTGMMLKAQAEKGILINELAATDGGTWSEAALAPSTVNALRPASTANFTNWWHANSKKTNTEAGVNAAGTAVDTDNTVAISSGVYYSDISDISHSDTAAVADTNAASEVYYVDGTGTTADTYDNGEGYYVKYTYYIKSSSNEALVVPAGQLKANVTATLQESQAQDLDKALRVGIKVNTDAKATIFAPVTGSTTGTYKVAGSTSGATFVEVTPYAADTDVAINAADVSLPKVTAAGLPVYVYVWFEGEDVNCKSDNLSEALNSYQIDIKFTDAALGTDS
jgi:hypothetical protein